ncbi:MAG: L-rhamnose mutarotase [Planctomycetota bacterium]|jgi:L-rhamnose mutarotase
MRRVCFLLKVRSDRLEAYRRVHETVWPEMLEALSRHGWTNYFESLEGVNPDEAMRPLDQVFHLA